MTAPGWLDGSLVFNDIVSISYIRIAIFVLALLFLALFLIVMNRTRLGLEVRAVTQNPRMAASMGINPDRINMLTFGFGSGIAGIAGVAIGLYAKVTSEMGSDYIVQSFMTVVVGAGRQHLGHAAGRHDGGHNAKGDRVVEPLQHACGPDLHDPVHHSVHSVPAQGHHRPQRSRGGGLSHDQRSHWKRHRCASRSFFWSRNPSVLIFHGLPCHLHAWRNDAG